MPAARHIARLLSVNDAVALLTSWLRSGPTCSACAFGTQQSG